jgi:tetratricopeptide (TPR) repeat protein
MRILFILVCTLAISPLLAQKKSKKNQPEPVKTETPAPTPVTPAAEQPKQDSAKVDPLIAHFIRKYSTALAWNDYDVAKDALYDLIVENPGNDSLIYDLAIFYYERQKYASSILVGQELLSRNPKSLPALEITASGYENMGIADRALQSYESLYLLTNTTGSLYKMAFLQYDLKRFKEAAASADILLTKPEMETNKVVFPDAQNKQKEYPMKTAVLNLRGMIELENGNKVEARKWFDKALTTSPDFVPAKQNISKTK